MTRTSPLSFDRARNTVSPSESCSRYPNSERSSPLSAVSRRALTSHHPGDAAAGAAPPRFACLVETPEAPEAPDCTETCGRRVDHARSPTARTPGLEEKHLGCARAAGAPTAAHPSPSRRTSPEDGRRGSRALPMETRNPRALAFFACDVNRTQHLCSVRGAESRAVSTVVVCACFYTSLFFCYFSHRSTPSPL